MINCKRDAGYLSVIPANEEGQVILAVSNYPASFQTCVDISDAVAFADLIYELAGANTPANYQKANTMQVNVKKLHTAAQLPEYATAGAACFDLRAIDGGEVGPNGGTLACRTGLAFEVPAGHVMLIYSRSGHGFKNSVRLVNAVGVIDADYRGEVAVKLINDSPQAFHVEPGDRIAQAMIIPVPAVTLVEAAELSDTDRGAGGFGSTGQ